MYPFETKSEQELLIEQALVPKDEKLSVKIGRLIRNHIASLEDIRTGVDYYNHNPDIFTYDPPTDLDGTVDETKPDWRIDANFHKLLVDQKVARLLGNAVLFKMGEGKEDDEILQKIGETFDDEFDDLLNDIFTAASNKGIEWVHPWIDENGELQWHEVPAERFVPIYEDDKKKKMIAGIYFYRLDGIDFAEYWTDETVQYFEKQNESYIESMYFNMEYEKAHFKINGQGYGWGRVPFIPFRNNTQEVSDIWMYKNMIDAYNKRLSDMQNTFDASTEYVYVLKGYEGQDLTEFLQGIKHYKAINVDGESGGVDTIQIQIPVNETKEYLKMMRENIIDFGRGVDFTSDKFGNSPSGVALHVLFSGLDMKAKQLERKARVGIRNMLWFVFQHHNINRDPKEVEMVFQYDTLQNKLEDAQIAQMSNGIISKQTIVANHPWVDDVQGEMERLEQDIMNISKTLPPLTGGEVNDEHGPGTDKQTDTSATDEIGK